MAELADAPDSKSGVVHSTCRFDPDFGHHFQILPRPPHQDTATSSGNRLAPSSSKVTKIDLKKDLKELYGPSAKAPVEVKVPAFQYLMIDGEGDPNTSKEFAAAVEALFAVAYTAKFMVKKGPAAVDYAVMPLEALWWADDMSNFAADKSKWKWTAMIPQPPFVSKKMLAAAIADVKQKKDLPGLPKLRVETLKEGRCAQILHIGPFSEEGPTIEKLHRFIAEEGRQPTGKHHEIYLSDIRRAAPGKWKTIVRQPME
jgi:hypothetical protein